MSDDEDELAHLQRIKNDDYEYKHNYSDSQKHPKKKKLKALIPSYEFAPRVPPASTVVSSNPKPSYGGRNPLTDWTEHETLVLLDAWGERFLKQGRKSLRSEEWQEVAEKVSQESRIERTDTQCRNRLDTLKKKYKKEKAKMSISDKGFASDWIYFKKMDALLSPPSGRAGLDSGEFVGPSNGLDSPQNSGSGRSEKDEKPRLRPKRGNNGKKDKSFKLLADSFRKFSDIYEKIERGKRQQMAELERMRMDFHRDLELQKREILERAQAEIARIRQGRDDDDDNDDDDEDDDDRVMSG
ncbi:sequence-specific DNA binding transcription factors [Striga asiatica]|uniref:Sequence-specific DNA binding transcription factors n=1 Tax=Striga asiatica TaxID=4170 RepID=A0A5A7R557_STRAF|nr:sequence-specific DNA binding transcription factors [Striga asiatica]